MIAPTKRGFSLMPRPKLPAGQKRNPHKIWLNQAEEDAIKAAASRAGVPYAEWIRDIAVQFCDPSKLHRSAVLRPLETASTESNDNNELFHDPSKRFNDNNELFHDPSKLRADEFCDPSKLHRRGDGSSSTVADVTSQQIGPESRRSAVEPTGKPARKPQNGQSTKKQNDSDNSATQSRTRGRARPVHIGNGIVSQNGETKETSSSLRSEQGFALSPATELATPDLDSVPESPWTLPVQSKLAITLSDGTRVTPTWLFANGHRLPAQDVARILAMPSSNALRKAMIIAFSQALRKAWIRRWCAAHGRKVNAWRDTPRSSRAIEAAAAVWAGEYAERGMTADTYIDAAHELRPKSLKFPTVDMLGGMLAERIKSWVPPDQRERDKPWDAHADRDGHTWITLPDDGAGPVLLVRNADDRARLMRMAQGK